MSYPPPRYLGESGEVSASYRPGGQPPDLAYPSGTRVHYLASSASTNEAFGLYRWEMGVTPGGADPHFHRGFSESFYVLAGAVRLYNGANWIDATTGDFLFVPEGGIHAFRNESGAPASMLILFSPGAPREEYFETLVQLAAGREMSDEQRAEFFVRHDNNFLPS